MTSRSRGGKQSEDRLRRAATDAFGWDELGDHQLAAMQAVTAGDDTLAVLPSGAGKSAIYQVPALLRPGLTVVVSPLIALQHDQVAGLDDSDAPQAVAVNSGRTGVRNAEAWEKVRSGQAAYLFLSPEQLAKPEVLDRLAADPPSLFVVDEAHCVSAWGHDFHPDYLRLHQVAERFGRPPILALTATAAPPVRKDIVQRLGMRNVREVVASFDRPNLHLRVVRFTDDRDKRRAVTEHVAASHGPGLLLGYFGEELPEPCGRCDVCAAASAESLEEPTVQSDSAGVAYPIGSRVRHAEWGEGDVMSREQDRITVLFASVGYRTLSLPAVDEHDLLTLTERS